MTVLKFSLAGLLSIFAVVHAGSPAIAAKADVVPLSDFMGCWMSTKEPAGTMIQYDGFKKDGYTLVEEFVMLTIEPVEGGTPFRNLVKGSLDVWSTEKKYYLPTIYYDAVYDPVRGVIITDSTFYLVDDRLIFVHHRTSDSSSDRALRHLEKVDCAEISKNRTKIQSEYSDLTQSSDKIKYGLDN